MLQVSTPHPQSKWPTNADKTRKGRVGRELGEDLEELQPHSAMPDRRAGTAPPTMREFADLPPKARQIMVASVMKAHQLLIDNLAAARGSRDDNDSLAGLIVTFFSGICLEQNLGPDRARITKKIDAFMRLIRAI